jgi:hypothetical protein
VKGLADDVTTVAAVGGTWAAHLWKAHAAFEMLAVRAYTAWESFSHDVLILTLAADTSELANETGLSIKPTRVTADMAEALLTARGYLEFRDVADLKGRARRWLGQARSPFARMQPADRWSKAGRRSADSRSDPRIVEHEPLRIVRQVCLESVVGEGLEPYDAPPIVNRADE